MTTSLQPGAVIDGKYRLLRRIGEGGMGTVFEGENVRIRRKVAIKLLHEHVATSPEFAQRFVREARASARIGSDHVCDVLDLGDLDNGEKYIVMELLDGESLEEHLVRVGKMTSANLAHVAFEMLEGLGAMHQVSVVHRDLKPANVFLCKRPGGVVSVKILDFGVAKIEPTEEDPSGISDMTSTGTMMGTPLYMSPEQARGARDVDGRTDLYSASVIFYRALTGDVPHTGTTLHELLFKIVLDTPKPIRESAPEVDEELEALVMRGLERDPEKRYSSARQFQEAIAKWGEAHGLTFKITLPDELPPLRKQTGGYPAAVIENAPEHLRTGNTPSVIDPRVGTGIEGPPTPVSAVAQTQPAVSRPPGLPAGPSTMMSGSVTPAPAISTVPIADTLLAGHSQPKVPVVVRSVAPEEPSDVAKPKTPAPVSGTKAKSRAPTVPSRGRSAPPAEPQGTSKTTYVVGALVAIAAAVVGVKLGTADRKVEPLPNPTTTLTTSAAPPPPASTPSALVVPPVVVDAGPGVMPVPAVPTGPTPHPTTTAAPTATTTTGLADAGGRTIRTDPGF